MGIFHIFIKIKENSLNYQFMEENGSFFWQNVIDLLEKQEKSRKELANIAYAHHIKNSSYIYKFFCRYCNAYEDYSVYTHLPEAEAYADFFAYAHIKGGKWVNAHSRI